MHGTKEASNDGNVKVCIIHVLTLVIKNSYTYCKSLLALEAKYYYACSQGGRLVGKDHRSSPTATHKDAQSRYTSCFKFVTQLYPYVHVMGLTNFNTSISQIHNYSTSMTLILLPPYLKTIIKHQTYLSIQFTQKKVSHVQNTKYINIKQITMLLTTLQII